MIFFCQIFLEPLGQVVGSSTSKFQLLSACKTAEDTNRLHELGCMLGVGEWTNQIQKKCQTCPNGSKKIWQKKIIIFCRILKFLNRLCSLKACKLIPFLKCI
jgi:hypothetical protein